MVIEQQDGFRIDFNEDHTNTVMYLKKSNGWTRHLADDVFENLAMAYNHGLNDAECGLEHFPDDNNQIAASFFRPLPQL